MMSSLSIKYPNPNPRSPKQLRKLFPFAAPLPAKFGACSYIHNALNPRPWTKIQAEQIPNTHPPIHSPNPATTSKEAESPQRGPLTEVELGTPSPLGEDARIEERDDRSRERDEGESLASAGSRGEAAAGYSMERTLADGALDGDKGVGRRRERVEVGGAEVGDERAEVIGGGDVPRGVMVPPFEMGELEYLRHIPSFRIGERERGGRTLCKTEGLAWEEGAQATAGKSEMDGGFGSRGLRAAWWKTGFAVRGIPSLGEEVAEKEQGRKGGLGGGRVMRRCVSVCDF